MLNRIIDAIDEELNRLVQAREILAAYTEDVSLNLPKPRHKRKQKKHPTKEAVAFLPEVKVTILPPKPEPKRRDRILKPPQSEPRALTSRIPTSPVVVSPAADKQPKTPPQLEDRQASDFGARILAEERKLGSRIQS